MVTQHPLQYESLGVAQQKQSITSKSSITELTRRLSYERRRHSSMRSLQTCENKYSLKLLHSYVCKGLLRMHVMGSACHRHASMRSLQTCENKYSL